MFSNRKVVIHSILYMVFIFILSSIPDTDEKIYISVTLQNLLHTPLFGILAFLWMRAFYYNKFAFADAIKYTLLITMAYGIFDEFHQSFVPGRDASIMDVGLDFVGCIAGAFIYRWKK